MRPNREGFCPEGGVCPFSVASTTVIDIGVRHGHAGFPLSSRALSRPTYRRTEQYMLDVPMKSDKSRASCQ